MKPVVERALWLSLGLVLGLLIGLQLQSGRGRYAVTNTAGTQVLLDTASGRVRIFDGAKWVDLPAPPK